MSERMDAYPITPDTASPATEAKTSARRSLVRWLDNDGISRPISAGDLIELSHRLDAIEAEARSGYANFGYFSCCPGEHTMEEGCLVRSPRSVPTRPDESLTVERLAAAVIEQWDENTSSDWFRDTSLRDIDRGVERMRERIEALRAALVTPSEGER